MINVFFVCLGNICRSPMAEGLFIHHLKTQGLEDKYMVDSGGTGGWHIGALPDPRMREVAAQRGVELPTRARKVEDEDFKKFDYILAMDQQNYDDLVNHPAFERGKAKVFLMRHFDEQHNGEDVPDPYYRDAKGGFDDVFEMLDRSTLKMLEVLETEKGL